MRGIVYDDDNGSKMRGGLRRTTAKSNGPQRRLHHGYAPPMG